MKRFLLIIILQLFWFNTSIAQVRINYTCDVPLANYKDFEFSFFFSSPPKVTMNDGKKDGYIFIDTVMKKKNERTYTWFKATVIPSKPRLTMFVYWQKRRLLQVYGFNLDKQQVQKLKDSVINGEEKVFRLKEKIFSEYARKNKRLPPFRSFECKQIN
tara:strand:- start:51 stop:524 length:474 start_codon:yes stop_codon:yes gene_type:complete